MIKSVVIESGSCGEVAADQELPSYQVLAALVVSLRGELARAQERIAEFLGTDWCAGRCSVLTGCASKQPAPLLV